MRVRHLSTRLRQKHREAESDAAMHRAGYLEWRERLKELGRWPAGLRVLDIGTGDRAPLALQFAADGATVEAIDIRPVALGRGRPRMWWELARQNGLGDAARTIGVDMIHTWRYWARLADLVGTPLPHERVHVQQADASQLPFADSSFDIVVTSAVWEHLPDVPGATREAARVLAPDGVAVIQIALFQSLQGGHHADWHSVEARPRTVRPWDHLRAGSLPSPLFLNGWRESQYRTAVDDVLAVVAWEPAPPEGAEYLTPALRAELDDYSERELLTPSLTVWCRARHNAARV